MCMAVFVGVGCVGVVVVVGFVVVLCVGYVVVGFCWVCGCWLGCGCGIVWIACLLFLVRSKS